MWGDKIIVKGDKVIEKGDKVIVKGDKVMGILSNAFKQISLAKNEKRMVLALNCMYLSTSLIISSTSSSVNLDDHLIVVIIITLVMIS